MGWKVGMQGGTKRMDGIEWDGGKEDGKERTVGWKGWREGGWEGTDGRLEEMEGRRMG